MADDFAQCGGGGAVSAAGIDIDESDFSIHNGPIEVDATSGRARPVAERASACENTKFDNASPGASRSCPSTMLRACFLCPASISLSAGDCSARLTATAQKMSKSRSEE